jgi:FdhE protein
MTETDPALDKIQKRHPEWTPWLAVVQAALRECGNHQWDSLAPRPPAVQTSKVPLLAEASLDLAKSPVPAFIRWLLRIAYQNGTSQMASLKALRQRELDVCVLFKAALQQDHHYLNEVAAAHGAEPSALQAVIAMAPQPFLHACNRAWARSITPGWMESYCPICGAWPAFAEVRGIERTRHFRCGRCGGEWQAQFLSCPFCGTTEHHELLSLVPENRGDNATIEACKRCMGYIKSFATLQGSLPTKVFIDDLDSVELDVAAVQQGYKRPEGNGYSFDIHVFDSSA